MSNRQPEKGILENYILKRAKYLFVVFIILSFTMLYAQTADFLITEDPAQLIIYNKYQQLVSGKLQSQLVPYTPFRILSKDELLSDQISHAARVEYDNQVLFLLKDENDLYLPEQDSYIQFFKNCRLIGDTIKITKDKRIFRVAKPEQINSKNDRQYLEKEQLCIRLFKYKHLYYLLRIGDEAVYGWTQLPKSGWEIYHPIYEQVVTIPDNLVSRLRIRIESANQDYDNFFSHFNNKYKQNKTVPYWNLEISNQEIRGILNEPAAATYLKNSNRYLMQDIDNIFLGSGFTAVFMDSLFTIGYKIKQ